MTTSQTKSATSRETEVVSAQKPEPGLPYAAAAAFMTSEGSAAVTSASPGDLTQTQTSITTLPDGSNATIVVTTTTVTTTTTTTSTYITGEMPPIQVNQLQAATAVPASVSGAMPVIPPITAATAAPAQAVRPTTASATSPAYAPAVAPAAPAATIASASARTAATPSHAKADYSKPLGHRFMKRLFDIVFSAAVIVIGFIPGVILSLAIMASTKGSPFYVQKRVKKGGEEFNIYKFRTMVADADNLEKYLSPEQLKEWHAEHKVENDPRITKLGGFLRRTSIDEFPNFLNVFAGQMSVVGPRAITEEELDWFGKDRDKLLSVPAGVTGWWQVSSRNEATFESGERQELELYYIDHASIGFDIRIFFKTFTAVFSGTGK